MIAPSQPEEADVKTWILAGLTIGAVAMASVTPAQAQGGYAPHPVYGFGYGYGWHRGWGPGYGWHRHGWGY